MKATRNYKIDFLKFIFTLIVILSHSGGISSTLPDIYNSYHWSSAGAIAVEFFFILSGYFMVVSYHRNRHIPSNCGIDTQNYIKKKIKGMALPYLISFFILFPCTWTYKNIITKDAVLSLQEFISRIAKSLYFSIPEILGIYMTGPLDRRYTYNEPTWYLSSMIFVMIPIFYLLCRDYNFTVKIFVSDGTLWEAQTAL